MDALVESRCVYQTSHMDDLVSAVIDKCTSPDTPTHPTAVYTIVFPSECVPGMSSLYAQAAKGIEDEYFFDGPDGRGFVQYRVRISHPVRQFFLERESVWTEEIGVVPTISKWTSVAIFSTIDTAIDCLRAIIDTVMPNKDRYDVFLFCNNMFAGSYDLKSNNETLVRVTKGMYAA